MAPSLRSVTATLVNNLFELLKSPPVLVSDVRKLHDLLRTNQRALEHALSKGLAQILDDALQGRAIFEVLRVFDYISKASARGRAEVRTVLHPKKLTSLLRQKNSDLECCQLTLRLLCLVVRGPSAREVSCSDLRSVLQTLVKFGCESPIVSADACRFTFLYFETLGDNRTAILRAINGSDEAPQHKIEGLYELSRHLLVEDDILSHLVTTFRHIESTQKRMVRAGVLVLSIFARSRLKDTYVQLFRVAQTDSRRDARINNLLEIYNEVFSAPSHGDNSEDEYFLEDDFEAEDIEGSQDLFSGDQVLPDTMTSFSAQHTLEYSRNPFLSPKGKPAFPSSTRPSTARPRHHSAVASSRQVRSAQGKRTNKYAVNPQTHARGVKKQSKWRKKQSMSVLLRAAKTIAPDKYSTSSDIERILHRMERVPELPKMRFFQPMNDQVTNSLYAGGGEEYNTLPKDIPSSEEVDVMVASVEDLNLYDHHHQTSQRSGTGPKLSSNKSKSRKYRSSNGHGSRGQLMPGWDQGTSGDHTHGPPAKQKINLLNRDQAIVEDFSGGLDYADRLKIMIEDVNERIRAVDDNSLEL